MFYFLTDFQKTGLPSDENVVEFNINCSLLTYNTTVFLPNKPLNQWLAIMSDTKKKPIFKTYASFFQKSYIDIYNHENNKYCTITRDFRINYTRYNVHLEQLNQTIYLFGHRRRPLIDFWYKNKRYRWLNEYQYNNKATTYLATYSLYQLDDNQASLVDDLVDNEVNRNNKIIDYTLKNLLVILLPDWNEKFGSSNRIGQLRSNTGLDLLTLQNRLSKVYFKQPPGNELNEDVFVFLATSAICKVFQITIDQGGNGRIRQ